jgi:hypothetical protein
MLMADADDAVAVAVLLMSGRVWMRARCALD